MREYFSGPEIICVNGWNVSCFYTDCIHFVDIRACHSVWCQLSQMCLYYLIVEHFSSNLMTTGSQYKLVLHVLLMVLVPVLRKLYTDQYLTVYFCYCSHTHCMQCNRNWYHCFGMLTPLHASTSTVYCTGGWIHKGLCTPICYDI